MPTLNINVPDECKCGGDSGVVCQPGSAYGSIIPWSMIANPPGVVDTMTKHCLEEVLKVHAALQPKEVLYAGMSELAKSNEARWHDPAQRLKLLQSMGLSLQAMKNHRPPDMSDEEYILLWAVRLKGYLDLINRIALYDVIPQDQIEQLDYFFTRF